MINSIIQSISIALNAEFGDAYTNYTEEIKQGLKEPCFFIQCLNPTHELFLGRRYFRENSFCIQYFPFTQKKQEECNDVATRMYMCLEWLTDVAGTDEHWARGTKMKYEIVDGVLNFFVNYDMFVYKVVDNVPMEDISTDIAAKG